MISVVRINTFIVYAYQSYKKSFWIFPQSFEVQM